MAGKGAETPEVTQVPGKDLVNKDGSVTQLIEWATQNANTPEEILDLFADADIAVSHGEEITADYIVVHGDVKESWCTNHEGKMIAVVQWHFYENATGEFVAMHVVTPHGKFIVNDSAKGGIFGQLKRITNRREELDPESGVNRTSTAGLVAARGLRRNKTFQYDTRPKSDKPGEEHFGYAIKRADLDNVVKHPMAFRADSKPTWSFDL